MELKGAKYVWFCGSRKMLCNFFLKFTCIHIPRHAMNLLRTFLKTHFEEEQSMVRNWRRSSEAVEVVEVVEEIETWTHLDSHGSPIRILIRPTPLWNFWTVRRLPVDLPPAAKIRGSRDVRFLGNVIRLDRKRDHHGTRRDRVSHWSVWDITSTDSSQSVRGRVNNLTTSGTGYKAHVRRVVRLYILQVERTVQSSRPFSQVLFLEFFTLFQTNPTDGMGKTYGWASQP